MTLLHSVDKNRLWRFIPGNRRTGDAVTVRWEDPTGELRTAEVAVDVRWQDQDSDYYPCVVLEPNPAAVPVDDDTLDDWERTAPVSENDIQRRVSKRTKLYDELNVKVAVKSPKNGIPKSEVADQLAQQVYERFKFESDRLNRKAVDSDGNPIQESVAMKVMETPPGIKNTSAMTDEVHTARRWMRWDIEYTYQYNRDITAVDKLKWTLTTDVDADDDEDSTWSGTVDIDISDASGDQDS